MSKDASRPIPELTVAMPAHNAGQFIRQAMESALCQEDVEFEIIVVDDASTDDTAAIVQSFGDPRIRLLRNDTQRGIAAGQNRIVEASRAPFITHLDADDLITRTHACRRLLDCIQSSEDLGQVHCYYFRIDAHGVANRNDCLSLVRHQRNTRVPGLDYRHALLRIGSVMNGLRMYRKSALLEVGPFDESIRFGVDFEMALRILERHRITVVPEVLCAVRKHGENTTSLRFPALRFWRQRFNSARKLTRTGQITFTRLPQYRLSKLFALSLLQELGVMNAVRRAGMRIYHTRLRAGKALRNGLLAVDRKAAAGLARWPLPRDRGEGPGEGISEGIGEAGTIGYYLWHFPVPSQTFVRRELQALRDQGLEVAVFADDAEAMEGAETSATYLKNVGPETRARYRRSFLLRRPLRTLSLFAYVRGHRYGFWKSLTEDWALFGQAVILAGLLEERGVRHLHAPWADRCAFVAMIAARLAGISYSVQARAHDLHRKRSAYGLREKLGAARFVVTNSDYNRDHILELIGPHAKDRVHRIYEGIRPAAFQLSHESRDPGPARILTVARLIEEKGLIHLLHAAHLLRERGLEFRWEIVGGPERPTYTAYEVELRSLHRRMALEPLVTFTGSAPFSAVQRRMQAADLFVLPCVVARNGGRDITPNALLEAMASGLPVISTQIAAIPEIVQDGVSGVLVPPGDPEALADAVWELWGNPDRRERLGARAREKVEARFDLDRNVGALAGLFAGA